MKAKLDSTTESALLAQGIQFLLKDAEIESLVAPRYDEIFSLLARYIKEIELFNPAYGLVGANNSDELVVKHILDCLAPLGIISALLKDANNTESRAVRKEKADSAPQIADIGSGAGLPGIPLAITLPNCEFTLVERMGRRAGFLCGAKAVLALSNIRVEEKELSGFVGLEGTAAKHWKKTQEKPKSTNPYSLVTFRAFKPLEPKLLKTLLRACAEGGVIAAYKGKREKAEAEAAALKEIQGKWEIIPYTVPFLDEERCLLVIRAK